jgi:acetyltransferase-like isoleucine patch superfamily enzyme
MIKFIYNKIYNLKIKIRNLFWKLFFYKIGLDSNVFGRIIVYYPENVEIGDHSTLNEGVLLNARTRITIGNYVHISSYCILNTGELDYSKIEGERTHKTRPIVIEDGVWMGSGAIINPGVKIGRNAVIGAGAVVTNDIESNSIAVGVPAKVIKKITD